MRKRERVSTERATPLAAFEGMALYKGADGRVFLAYAHPYPRYVILTERTARLFYRLAARRLIQDETLAFFGVKGARRNKPL